MRDYFLKTERIGFSIWEENDLQEAIELWGNSAVTKYISQKGTMSKEEIHNRLAKEIETYNKFGVQYWPIYLSETGDHIGCCGLRPYDLEQNINELGIHIKQDYWGEGYAREACIAVIDYAFHTLNVEAIFAGHNPQNEASAKLLKKIGFHYTHDEFYEPTGLNHPSYLMRKVD